jgi:hypothetical protein
VRNSEKNIDQQYRNQGDQQNLILETEVPQDAIRWSCRLRPLCRRRANPN